MHAEDYWAIFLETGAPEVYLLYRQALAAAQPCSAERAAEEMHCI